MFKSAQITFQKGIVLDADGLSVETSSVNKPTSLLFSTSSMAARVHSRLPAQNSPLQTTTLTIHTPNIAAN